MSKILEGSRNRDKIDFSLFRTRDGTVAWFGVERLGEERSK